jgi:RNA-directed DNA polymerase
VIQQAILQVLPPILDPEFSESSYGSRPKRSAHGAIRQVKTIVKSGYRTVVDVDLGKFFDSVNHGVLMARVAQRVTDQVIGFDWTIPESRGVGREYD